MTPVSTQPRTAASPSAPAPDFWRSTWRFPQAVTLMIGWIGAAAIAQALTPAVEVRLPGHPWNWVIVFAPLAMLAVVQRLMPRSPILRGLGGTPLAIVSVAALAVVTMPGAIWPQGEDAAAWQRTLGLDHAFNTPTFALALGIVLMNLSLASARRAWPLQRSSVAFLLVHLGLILALGASTAGSAAIIKARMILVEGHDFAGMAKIDTGQVIELPFALRLLDFRIDSFAPTLALAHKPQDSAGGWPLTPGQKFVATGASETISGYRVEVEQYIEHAAVEQFEPMAIDDSAAMPAAKVKVFDPTGKLAAQGWITPPSREVDRRLLPISADTILILQPPRPRLFESKLLVRHAGQSQDYQALVRVNQPLSIAGYQIYQTSYDESAGAASRLSILELVRDPSLPMVYAGFYMLIAGCCIHLWQAGQKLRRPISEGAA